MSDERATEILESIKRVIGDDEPAPSVKQYEEFLYEPTARRWEIFLALAESGQYAPLEIAEAIPAIEKAIIGGSVAKLSTIKGGKGDAA